MNRKQLIEKAFLLQFGASLSGSQDVIDLVPKLKPFFKSLWLHDLRGGEYKQGAGQLMSGQKHYCCLGVASKISIVGGAGYFESSTMHYGDYTLRCNDFYSMSYPAPELFQKWFADPLVSTPYRSDQVIRALGFINDYAVRDDAGNVVKDADGNHRATFLEIADIIEKYL